MARGRGGSQRSPIWGRLGVALLVVFAGVDAWLVYLAFTHVS